ncbi:MAG: hypothetical protein ABI128_04225 [Rhodanobacter sp.]
MNTTSPEDIEARMARLERSLQRTRWGLFGLLLLVVAFFFAWYGVTGIVQHQVRAHRIVAVDDAGAMRVRIGQDAKDTGRSSRAAGVILYDSTGHERGGMGTMANGRVAFGLDAPNVAAGQVSDRLGMMVDEKGHSLFMLMDGQGAPVVQVKSGDKGGALQVSEVAPDGQHLQVRTLGVKGDTQSTVGGD